jgi:hypothetical protein
MRRRRGVLSCSRFKRRVLSYEALTRIPEHCNLEENGCPISFPVAKLICSRALSHRCQPASKAERVLAAGAFPHQRVISQNLDFCSVHFRAKSMSITGTQCGAGELRRGLIFWYP